MKYNIVYIDSVLFFHRFDSLRHLRGPHTQHYFYQFPVSSITSQTFAVFSFSLPVLAERPSGSQDICCTCNVHGNLTSGFLADIYRNNSQEDVEIITLIKCGGNTEGNQVCQAYGGGHAVIETYFSTPWFP